MGKYFSIFALFTIFFFVSCGSDTAKSSRDEDSVTGVDISGDSDGSSISDEKPDSNADDPALNDGTGKDRDADEISDNPSDEDDNTDSNDLTENGNENDGDIIASDGITDETESDNDNIADDSLKISWIPLNNYIYHLDMQVEGNWAGVWGSHSDPGSCSEHAGIVGNLTSYDYDDTCIFLSGSHAPETINVPKENLTGFRISYAYNGDWGSGLRSSTEISYDGLSNSAVIDIPHVNVSWTKLEGYSYSLAYSELPSHGV